MPRFASLSVLGVCLGLLPMRMALAADVTIDGESPRQSIMLVVEDAPVETILENLREKYGFEIGGIERAIQRSDPLSLKLSGSLYSILERLLRNRNHVIVRSPDNLSGIEKVMILDADYGSGQPKASARGGSDGAPGKLLQAYSSENGARQIYPKIGGAPDE